MSWNGERPGGLAVGMGAMGRAGKAGESRKEKGGRGNKGGTGGYGRVREGLMVVGGRGDCLGGGLEAS